MRRPPSLRSQLNQIRLWVRQGRTDAWIAHKLDVSIEQLARFKREHVLDEEGAAPGPPADPLSVPPPEDRPPERESRTSDRQSRTTARDTRGSDAEPDESETEERPAEERESRSASPRSRGAYRESRARGRPSRSDDPAEPRERDDVRRSARRGARDDEPPADVEPDHELEEGADAPARPRRRGRRGGRRRRRDTAFEATFDHGDEGYGLWLDPAVADDPVYTEHWAGHRAVTVSVSAEEITIRRVGADDAVDAEAAE